MKKIIFFLVFILLLSSCFAEQREIEGLTDEIYRECSGIWTMEKRIENVRITGPWDVSWGDAFGRQSSLLIDLWTDSKYEIWPIVEPLVVKSIEKPNENTIKMIVGRPGNHKDGIVIIHLLNDHRMWIESTSKSGSSFIDFDGSNIIYRKVSGPDIEPLFTKKSDEKELMSPP